MATLFEQCQERTAEASTVQRICKDSKTLSFGVEEEIGSEVLRTFNFVHLEYIIVVTSLPPNSTILTGKWSEG